MYVNDVKALNDRIEKIQKERTKAEMKKEMLERRLQDEIAKYEKTYKVSLSGKNFDATKALIKAEGARVSKAIQEEYAFKLKVVEAIEKGNIAEANKLLNIQEKPLEGNKDSDESALEIVTKNVMSADNVSLESLSEEPVKTVVDRVSAVDSAKKPNKKSSTEEVIKVKKGVILKREDIAVEEFTVGKAWSVPVDSKVGSFKTKESESSVVKPEGIVFTGNIEDIAVDDDEEPDTISFDGFDGFDIEDEEPVYETDEVVEKPKPESHIEIDDDDLLGDFDVDDDDYDDDDFGFGSMLKGTKFGK